MQNRLKKNQKVVVITGKDKGKIGNILELCNKHDKVKVRGISMMTKHVKAKKQGETSSIQKREAFIHVSNVMPIDSMTGKPVRGNKSKQD